jgi:hypothetical protein
MKPRIVLILVIALGIAGQAIAADEGFGGRASPDQSLLLSPPLFLNNFWALCLLPACSTARNNTIDLMWSSDIPARD